MRNRLFSCALRLTASGSLRNTTRVTSFLKQHVNTNTPFSQNKLFQFPAAVSRTFTTAADWNDEKFNEIVKGDKLVVFMKGTPQEPMCGFSKYVIQILTMHGCEHFKTLNVLEDEELRNRVKEFSNWPTIPQIYIDGEFVGGFDILLQMHQNGELIEELEKIGHRSNLMDAEKEDN